MKLSFQRVFSMPPRKRFNPSSHPATSHVKLHNRHLTFFIPHSKTDQFSRGHSIQLFPTRHSTTCPVRCMRAYLAIRPPSRGPLFAFRNGTPLTRHLCLRYLRLFLKCSGYNPMDFNTHSFRIGAATTAAYDGASIATIQHLGRWKSDAIMRYIRPYPPH